MNRNRERLIIPDRRPAPPKRQRPPTDDGGRTTPPQQITEAGARVVVAGHRRPPPSSRRKGAPDPAPAQAAQTADCAIITKPTGEQAERVSTTPADDVEGDVTHRGRTGTSPCRLHTSRRRLRSQRSGRDRLPPQAAPA